MAAARPTLVVPPTGGADNAWSSTKQPTSETPSPGSSVAKAASTSSAKGKTVVAAQPSGSSNAKKLRRRVALLSGVHLNLPSSPVVGPPPPKSSRETSWTFTAEWDSTGDGFVFSDLESSSSSGLSAASTRFFASPIPRDVSEDEVDFDTGSPLRSAMAMSTSLAAQLQAMASMSGPSVTTIIYSPVSPAVTDIFDLYTTTPSSQSFTLSDDESDLSSAPSSPIDTPPLTDSSAPPSPPTYTRTVAKVQTPTISVTFFDEGAMRDQFAAAKTLTTTSYDDVSSPMPPVVAAVTSFEPAPWQSLLPEKSRYVLVPLPAGVVFKRPRPLPRPLPRALPPVPGPPCG
ncbi:hypothetical protein GSI_04846 [Ganoderma sinense ZZ0214-1]|uniref:Uncharacterized protein n=1 Tax=Ganoderma sinense ZZ0214-1 TaxID=1077348 RepID=A0A2G8SG57_9APHY|nr:hypothetical protein GSI_04846 [Ganoderma sinense ZZ0214-1]